MIALNSFLSFFIESFNRRYFILHALLNMYIVIVTYEDVFRSLDLMPFMKITNEVTDSSHILATIALHVFHTLYDAKSLKVSDWVHHIVSNFITGFLVINIAKHRISNVGAFFICGLPGMIDYILLSINIPRHLEKKINSYLNIYIRVPGLLWTCFMIYLYLYIHHISGSFYIMGLFLILSVMWNALFYAHLVIENYGKSQN